MVPDARPRWLSPTLLGLAVLALGVRLYFGPFLRDDAYITFKYARNLAQGAGFVFNPGEPVLGTTTPLYTLILAALYRLGISPLDAGYALGVASDTALVVALGWGLGQWSQRRPGRGWGGPLAAAFYALSAPLATAAVSGMETSFYLLLGWLGLYLYSQDRYHWSAFFLALMVLTRPDGLILVAVIVGDYIRRRLPWGPLALFLATLAPWVAFATLYFGSPLPQSVVAKAATAAQADPWLSLRLFEERFTQGPMVLGSLLFLVGAVMAWRRPFGLLLAWFVAYALLFIGANQFGNPGFEWYYAPLLLAFYALAGQGTVFLLGWATKASPQLAGYLTAGLSVAFLLVSANQVAQRRQAGVAWVAGREGGYRQVAEQLNRWAAPGEVLATSEIGVLGYFYQGPILDLGGLISPQAVGQTDAEIITGGEIPWMGVLSDHLSPELTGGAWFVANYALVYRLPVPDGRELLVWHRLKPPDEPGWRPVTAVADGIILDAYRLETSAAWPGQKLGLALRWQMVKPSAREFVAFTHLVGPDGRSFGMDRSLGYGLWAERAPDDQPMGEWRLLELPPDASPGVYVLEVGLYRWVAGDMEKAPWANAQGQALGNVLRLKGLVVKRQPPLRPEEISPQKSLNEPFGGAVALLGFDLPPTPWRRGEGATVTLYWQAQSTLAEDYTVFVHLSDQAGYVVAQDDSSPERGQNPTSSWYNGEVVADAHPLVLPTSLAPGTYRLSVGLYDGRGQRLRLADGRDEVSLGAVVIG